MLTGIDHIDIKVPDLAAFTTYFKALGFVEVHSANVQEGKVEFAFPGDDKVCFEVKEKKGITATTIDHIALSVDDLDGDITDLKTHSIVEDEGRARHTTPTGRVLSNVRDPSGAMWQLTKDE